MNAPIPAHTHIRSSRLRQIGWFVVLATCIAAFVLLTLKVNTVKSDVALAEREIIKLERATLLLETEFQARASQQQLADWNMLEFGYKAPGAEQFLENERQLAGLGTPRGANAPDPIRVARAPVESDEGIFPAMVSPITGDAAGEVAATATPSAAVTDEPAPSLPLAERLAFAEAFPSPETLASEVATATGAEDSE